MSPPFPGQRRAPARGRRAFAATLWGHAWVTALEDSTLYSWRLSRGRTYARQGMVGAVTIAPGQVKAAVQGSRPLPYRSDVPPARPHRRPVEHPPRHHRGPGRASRRTRRRRPRSRRTPAPPAHRTRPRMLLPRLGLPLQTRRRPLLRHRLHHRRRPLRRIRPTRPRTGGRPRQVARPAHGGPGDLHPTCPSRPPGRRRLRSLGRPGRQPCTATRTSPPHRRTARRPTTRHRSVHCAPRTPHGGHRRTRRPAPHRRHHEPAPVPAPGRGTNRRQQLRTGVDPPPHPQHRYHEALPRNRPGPLPAA